MSLTRYTPLDFSTPIPTIPEEQEDERPRALVVTVAGQLCALPVERVREVIRPRSITTIPGAPPVAHGLVNVRGMVVTVLDLAEALRGETDSMPRNESGSAGRSEGHFAPPPEGKSSVRAVVPSSVVLLEHGGRVIGVAVDAVHDVRPLEGDHTSAGQEPLGDAEPLAPPAAPVSSRIACGLASAGDDVVMRLDLGVLLARVMLSSEEGL